MAWGLGAVYVDYCVTLLGGVRKSTAVVALVCLGCQSRSEPAAVGGSGETLSGDATNMPPSVTASTPLPSRVIPGWAMGRWTGEGRAKITTLPLPGNQGVQLAWLKDKGTEHVGAVQLRLEIDGSGVATGELSGVLGSLSAVGVWQDAAPLHLDLRPAREGGPAFHGTLTLVWQHAEKRATGTLRAASGDGRFLRSADLEVSVAPEYK